MDVASLILLLVLAAIGWFWHNSMCALEVARTRGKKLCGDANVQFLDDTVATISLGVARDKFGRRVLRRTYRFEFSETGNSRLEGRLVVLGDKIESATMEPYQILPQTDTSLEPARDLNLCDDTNTGDSYGGCCGGCGKRDGVGNAGRE